MRRAPWSQVLLLALLCVAMLGGRMSGAHLHLCLDGSEPPSELHLFDGGQYHHDPGSHHDPGPHHVYGSHQVSGTDHPHGDVSIALVGELTAKGKDQWQLPLVLLSALVLLGLLRLPRRLLVPGSSRFLLPPLRPFFLWPPLCGPPPLISP